MVIHVANVPKQVFKAIFFFCNVSVLGSMEIYYFLKFHLSVYLPFMSRVESQVVLFYLCIIIVLYTM
jgi:hypothetical protein